MSWIHIDDIVGIFLFALDNAEATGPINGTAPNPVRNADFSRALSSCSGSRTPPGGSSSRSGPPTPVRLMLGEVAGVITAGQGVLPGKAQQPRLSFKYPELAEALKDVFTARRSRSPPVNPRRSARRRIIDRHSGADRASRPRK